MRMYQAKALESAAPPPKGREVWDDDPAVISEDDMGDQAPPVDKKTYLTAKIEG